MAEWVEIDGSHGEGGGQILRTSLSLSAVTGRPVVISRIRAGRIKPGLQPQHLAAVRAAASLCDAELTGAEVASQRLTFAPRKPVSPGDYRFEIGTAGAAPLVAQTVLLPLALAEGTSTVTITGGTHVPHAPPAEYLERVYEPALGRAGVSLEAAYDAAGYYPRGGGRLVLEVVGSSPPRPLDLSRRGDLLSLRAFVIASELPDHVSDRGAAAVHGRLHSLRLPLAIELRRPPSPGAGAAVVLVAECEGGLAGFTGLGARGKPMERVAEEACDAFEAWWRGAAACDEHLADQLVLPAALARGESRWSTPVVTEHLRTVLWVTRQLLPVEASLKERSDGVTEVCLSG